MSASKKYWILLPLLLVFLASTMQAQEVIKPLKKLQLSEKTPADQVPVWTGVAVDSKLRAYVGGDDHKIRLWNLQTGEIEKKLARNIDWIKAVRLRPDGLILLSADMGDVGLMWETENPENAFTSLKGIETAVTCAAFTKDGSKVAIGTFGGGVFVFDAKTGAALNRLSVGVGTADAVAWSDDNQYLAASGRMGVIRVWNFNNGVKSTDLVGHIRRVHALTFQKDGMLISGGEDNRLYLWNPAEDKVLGSIENLPGKVRCITTVGLNKVAVGMCDNSLGVWNFETGAQTYKMEGHTGTIADMEWVESQKWLVTVGFDSSICVWVLDK